MWAMQLYLLRDAGDRDMARPVPELDAAPAAALGAARRAWDRTNGCRRIEVRPTGLDVRRARVLALTMLCVGLLLGLGMQAGKRQGWLS